jgi:hypothetical protein
VDRAGPQSILGCMFARYFVELGLEPEAVLDRILADPSAWLPGLATAANHQGDVMLASVGFGHEVRLERKVEVHLGTPFRLASKTILPLKWSPLGGGGLFPALDADLEVAHLGEARTQLAFSARYVPPLGAVGRALDRAFLSRVAEATIKDFLDGVAQAILSDVARSQPH